MATHIEAKATATQEEPKKEDEKATDQTQQQGHNPTSNPNPSDMRICITGGSGGLLLGATASMAGALAPKATIKKTPKADIF